MTEAVVEQVVETPNAETEDADFAKGFAEARGVQPPAEEKTEPKPEVKVEVKVEEQAQAQAKPTLIAGMTEEQWNAAVAKAVDAETLRKEVRQNFGQIGELKRTLGEINTKLAAGAGSGAARKITAAMLKRVNEELPGLGDALAQDLSEVLGSAEVAQAKAESQGKAFDPDAYFKDAIVPALEKLEARANDRAELRIVKSIHRDFETVVKSPEFGGWLKTLPEPRQKEIRESEDGFVAADAVTEFKGYVEKQKKAKEQKTTRLEAAVTPQGAAQAGGPIQKDDEALFNDGFNTAGKKYAR